MSWRLGVLMLVAAVGCGGAASRAPAHRDSRARLSLAFVVNRSGFNEIWRMRANGKARRPLTRRAPRRTDASGSQQPTWSPSGAHIAYVSSGVRRRVSDSDHEIYRMRADGKKKRRLTFNEVPDFEPSWSPDGKTIAFVRVLGGAGPPTAAIYAMNADGTKQREIATGSPGSVFLGDPAWSPNGKAIAYTRFSFVDEIGEAAVYLMDASGSNPRKLADDAADPSWSPDGRRIAFVTGRDANGRCLFHDCQGYAPEIYVMRADGSRPRRVTRSRKTDVSPAWSPGGRRIAFARIATENSDYEIYSIRPDGSGLRRLTRNNVWDYQPAWRPR